MAYPPRGLRELDDYKELDDRIKKLEENNNASTSKTTTVKSTALDFDSIKNNLKTFLANKDEFKDYNFEASGLSNILDVLAYNTHFNGLIANFALNESFISTAQLRSSIVSLAEGIDMFLIQRHPHRQLLNYLLHLLVYQVDLLKYKSQVDLSLLQP